MRPRQFMTVESIPDQYFSERKTMYCTVDRVLEDGATLRARHLPHYKWTRRNPKPAGGVTLPVRIYGVDCCCPRHGGVTGSGFLGVGRVCQEPSSEHDEQLLALFAREAVRVVSELVLHRVVRLTLLSRDLYGRIVAVVETVREGWLFGAAIPTTKICRGRDAPLPPKGGIDLSIELAKHGLADLQRTDDCYYSADGKRLSGAYYCNGWFACPEEKRDLLERTVAVAKHRRTGMWSSPALLAASVSSCSIPLNSGSAGRAAARTGRDGILQNGKGKGASAVSNGVILTANNNTKTSSTNHRSSSRSRGRKNALVVVGGTATTTTGGILRHSTTETVASDDPTIIIERYNNNASLSEAAAAAASSTMVHFSSIKNSNNKNGNIKNMDAAGSAVVPGLSCFTPTNYQCHQLY